ncbi:hydroxyacylglutathione hydrolase [Chromatiaceae bacterium AAb-1]|nr:hydroxyacylglutathione hydrolase [Chromatiaceae bacterium AAb-1]
MLQITPIPAFEDNYIWYLCQPGHNFCVVIDPGDAKVVRSYLQQHHKTLVAILITHHHHDHTGGIAELLQQWPDARVIGPAAEQQNIPQLTETVTDNDQISLPQLNLTFSILAVPGHTAGHIAYYTPDTVGGHLFCGDTLFSAGCGRLFEGTAAQMFNSLSRLAALPDQTQVYCAHEYTLSNIKFARFIEPDNTHLVEYQLFCQRLRQSNLPTLPVLLEKEKQINPFLRCNNKELQHKWQKNTAQELFSWLRATKDQFKS